ncbi:MAG: hypothetical protein ABIP39_00650 [Polyangiaceae bacterium]
MASKELSRVEVQGVTKAARLSAEELIERVERLKLGIAQGFYEMGRCLGELLDKKLHLSLGFASFEAMLDERGVMSAMQAFKLIEVSRQFSKRDAVRLGPEKAYALVRHVARTKQTDDAAEYLLEGFPVGGRRRPIDEVTVRDILMATRTAVSRQQGERGESERARKDAESIRRKVHAALVKRVGDEAEVKVYFRRGGWRVVVELPAELAESALV